MFFKRFSQRQKDLNGKRNDVFNYNGIPVETRVQICHAWEPLLANSNELIVACHKLICEEIGSHQLPKTTRINAWGDSDPYADLVNFFCNDDIVGKELSIDVLEMITHIIYNAYYKWNDERLHFMVDKVNFRLQSASIGYRFEEGYLIRVDSIYTHSEIIKPSIAILGSAKKYASAFEQFIIAFDHMKNNKNEEAITASCKAYESTLKIILNNRKVELTGNETISQLVPKLFDLEELPVFLKDGSLKLAAMLQAYVGTIRNKTAAHGHHESREVESDLVNYMLNLTASNILFITRSFP